MCFRIFGNSFPATTGAIPTGVVTTRELTSAFAVTTGISQPGVTTGSEVTTAGNSQAVITTGFHESNNFISIL